MRPTLIILTASLLTLVPLLAPVAVAEDPVNATGGGLADRSICRRVAVSGNPCAELESRVKIVSHLTECIREASGNTYTCTVEFTLTLTVTGGSVGCGWAWTEPSGEDFGCVVIPGVPYQGLPVRGSDTYTGVPEGTSVRTVWGSVCVDYLTPIQDCLEFPVDTVMSIPMNAALIDPVRAAEEIVAAAEDVVDDFLPS